MEVENLGVTLWCQIRIWFCCEFLAYQTLHFTKGNRILWAGKVEDELGLLFYARKEGNDQIIMETSQEWRVLSGEPE